MPATLIAPTELRLWTSDDYHRMAEVGILHPDEPVELIAGQIIRKMSPQGSPHAAAIRRSRRWFEAALREVAQVQTQLPIQLDDYSEPEPDIAIVQPDPRDYSDRHPTAPEVWLLIEVSDSTLAYDCNTKAQVYAEAGIPDYWVLDIQRRQLHLFRDPQAQGYAVHQVFPDKQTITPLSFPDAAVAIAALLPLPPLT
ncbi:MAG: Uma2 family endonuclease [Cyanobacteria bacterium P01_G01_bin.54]